MPSDDGVAKMFDPLILIRLQYLFEMIININNLATNVNFLHWRVPICSGRLQEIAKQVPDHILLYYQHQTETIKSHFLFWLGTTLKRQKIRNYLFHQDWNLVFQRHLKLGRTHVSTVSGTQIHKSPQGPLVFHLQCYSLFIY